MDMHTGLQLHVYTLVNGKPHETKVEIVDRETAHRDTDTTPEREVDAQTHVCTDTRDNCGGQVAQEPQRR